MKGLTIIEHDDGRLVLAYTPANPSTDDLVRLLHSAMRWWLPLLEMRVHERSRRHTNHNEQEQR